MGGEFDVRVYSIDLTKSQVEDSFKGDQETSAYENGHRYSGCIGVMPFGIEWKSNMEDSTEAEEFINSGNISLSSCFNYCSFNSFCHIL